jgi:hypothetical protein
MSPELEQQVVEMLEKQRIRELLARLARAMDRVDVEGIKGCYTEDSLDDHGSFHGSGAEFAERPSRLAPENLSSTHHLGQSLIDLVDGEAYAETYFFVPLIWRLGGQNVEIQTAGRYIDRLVKVEGEWKLAFRRVLMDWANERPAVPWSELETFVRSQRWPADQVYDRTAWHL